MSVTALLQLSHYLIIAFHLIVYDFLPGLCAPTFVLAVTTFTASIGSVTSLKLTTGLADTVNVSYSFAPHEL